ncbi:DUF4040 domain-containing protein [bacterium]|nr:DUF4040 domain-containing protein [bacterium]
MEELFLLLAFNLLLVLCAFVILRVRDFFPLIILLNVCSVILVIIYVLLGAVDVAFTEAVVGASISTIFFMMLVTRIRTSGLRPEVSRRRIPSALVALAVGLVLLKGVNALPSFGDPDSVMQQHVSAQYVENSMHDMHTPNVVTAILADYRGFDTLIETTVIFAAALACLLILGGFWRMGVREEPRHHVFDSVILCTIVRPLAMGTQLYAVYVLLHGHYSPGGDSRAAFSWRHLLFCRPFWTIRHSATPA